MEKSCMPPLFTHQRLEVPLNDEQDTHEDLKRSWDSLWSWLVEQPSGILSSEQVHQLKDTNS